MKHDAIGQTFNRLTVIGNSHSRCGKRYVNARCECGTEKVVALGMLRQGEIKSCGCLRNEVLASRSARSDVGLRFHSWTIKADSQRRSIKGERYVIAECDCGSEREVLVKSIRSGVLTDCGCRRVEWQPLERLHRQHVKAAALIGQRIGQVEVLHIANEQDGEGRPRLVVNCSCGEIATVSLSRLKGTSTNCGGTDHLPAKGRSRTTEYHTYLAMLRRCYSPTAIGYWRYGGAGVTVCDRWRFGERGLSGLDCFMADMGRRPVGKHSIDRIDPWGDYEPTNCRWASWHEQPNNRRPRGALRTQSYAT